MREREEEQLAIYVEETRAASGKAPGRRGHGARGNMLLVIRLCTIADGI